ncbi:Essential recombination function protein [uncultured Caudovirales phage]|uniref:Essential recombination function protein n=1 Tax=uncultured Caudovirales phage TaxID=2100421 RepID=A0A6J5P5S3_9CAUD|nr:Essential recombination function protein [uncultured Caudovirales phage]
MTKETTIYEAFVKAQKAFGPALKTSTNPHFRSRYADLSACVEAVIDALNDNGIGLIQTTHECESGVTVETLLVHETGQTITSGKLHVPATKQDAQGYGSALTYARRYSLMAICGIAPEDDDGNRASKPVEVRAVEVKEPAKKSRIGKTVYDIRTLSEEQQAPAAEYLKQHSCEYSEGLGVWICPIKLQRLQSCVVESNDGPKKI